MGQIILYLKFFFDNSKFLKFLKRCREEGITVPILPGIKPITKIQHINILPKTFKIDIPEELASEVRSCKNDEEAKQVGIKWAVRQCRELLDNGLPGIHFYTMSASDSVMKIAEQVF